MCPHILGIDIAMDTFDLALRNEEGLSDTGHFNNSVDGFQSLRRWLANREVESLHACMEATSRYGEAQAAFL